MPDSVEHVLVVPRRDLEFVGDFTGFLQSPHKHFLHLFTDSRMSFLPRTVAETNENWKQIVTYCIMRHDDKVFTYARCKRSGESRLIGKRSLGIGGHVSSIDMLNDPDQPVMSAMTREIAEEVDFGDSDNIEVLYPAGLVNTDADAVGRVHLGVVFIADLKTPAVMPRKDEGLVDCKFSSVTELLAEKNQYEAWSQICIDHLASL